MAFWDRQLYFVFVWFYCTPLNRGAEAIKFSFFFVVCGKELSIQRDDGVLTSGIFQQSLQAQDRLFNQGMLYGIVDVAMPYLMWGTADSVEQ
jgi:hypothetical protein